MRNTTNTVKSQLNRLIQSVSNEKKIEFSERFFSIELLQYLKNYSNAFPASQWNHYDSSQDWLFLLQMFKLMKNGNHPTDKQQRKIYVLMQSLQRSIMYGTLLDTSVDSKQKLTIAPKMNRETITFKDLSDEQKEFIERAKNGENVLVDACIGSGKTTTIQILCNEMPEKRILYLTYNRLLKLDAKEKINASNTFVQNYHGYAFVELMNAGIETSPSDTIQIFNRIKPEIQHFDMLILDEYQDIEQEIAEMLNYLKEQNPAMQIVAVGDMAQKIYDKTTLNVPDFIQEFLGENYSIVNFTKCFRLGKEHAEMLGRIWNKPIVGVNEDCQIQRMSMKEVKNFLAVQNPSDILCLGTRNGDMSTLLNDLETEYPTTFNKSNVYASIRNNEGNLSPRNTDAIFTTFDSSKGLERPICVLFDYTSDNWQFRLGLPFVKYQILRNIFCVAASRGKNKIIFVKADGQFVNEDELSHPSPTNETFSRPFYISDMFDFKYKEDIEECYQLLKITKKRTKHQEIVIKNHDELIDLSPCIGIFQEVSFFRNYSIDSAIEFAKEKLKDELHIYQIDDFFTNPTLEEKILYLTYLETTYIRYVKQVETPFIGDNHKQEIHHQLRKIFSGNEEVQTSCEFTFRDKFNNPCHIIGRTDVVKDDVIYELKFVSELSHAHFLQLACYLTALGKEKGILWNVRTNDMYEVKIPARKRQIFMDTVIRTITKGSLQKYIPA